MDDYLPSHRPTSSPLTQGAQRLCGSVLLVFASVGSATASEDLAATVSERFQPVGRVLSGPADWVTLDRERVVFGSDKDVTVATLRPNRRLQARLALAAPAVEGVLARDNLYYVERVEQSERLMVLSLDSKVAAISQVRLNPEPRSSLHIAQMDDFLLVAEDEYGLRILELPHHRHGGLLRLHAQPDELPVIGFLALPERIVSVAASLRTIYIATDRDLVLVDGTIPALPGFAGRARLDIEMRALAANGPTVYVLGKDGLRVLDLSGRDETANGSIHPGVRGRSILLSGRTVRVASGEAGVQEFQDLSTRAATFFVQVGDVFFSPAGVVNVNVGDTVEWQKPPTVFTHNVFSCNPAQSGCGGVSSTETFTSGGVTTSPFNFSHTFTLAGSNPYVCQSHAFSMQGEIDVAGGPAAPPGVPDGSGGSTPMTVGKLDAIGSDLSIRYDASCPGAAGHDVVFGFRGQLPSAPGAVYGTSGGNCGVGTTSPATWGGTPAPASGDFLWWVIVADDGSGTEGPWGKDSTGSERAGTGTNGASGQCGNVDKDLANACGQ